MHDQDRDFAQAGRLVIAAIGDLRQMRERMPLRAVEYPFELLLIDIGPMKKLLRDLGPFCRPREQDRSFVQRCHLATNRKPLHAGFGVRRSVQINIGLRE